MWEKPGDSPVPSSVKVLLEPALVPRQPRHSLPPALLECPRHSPLACYTLFPGPWGLSAPHVPEEAGLGLYHPQSLCPLPQRELSGGVETMNAAPRDASGLV